jgi:hypothetical protein
LDTPGFLLGVTEKNELTFRHYLAKIPNRQ